MNAQVSNFYSLPTALFPQSIPHPARRHLIDDFQPDEGAVERFNQLLARFQHAPLDLDQIATAARVLPWPQADGGAPEHGRASGRERGGRYAAMPGVAAALTKKNDK